LERDCFAEFTLNEVKGLNDSYLFVILNAVKNLSE
jgi:hypothetical protein